MRAGQRGGDVGEVRGSGQVAGRPVALESDGESEPGHRALDRHVQADTVLIGAAIDALELVVARHPEATGAGPISGAQSQLDAERGGAASAACGLAIVG